MTAKKSHPKFQVRNYGPIKRVKNRWRKPRGIDSKARVKKNFAGAEPTIGYGNPEELRGIRASGKRAVLVSNMNELNAIIGNKSDNIEITLASALSRKKRIAMVKVAQQNKINVTNWRV